MRTETIYIRIITLALILVTAVNDPVKSQGTDSRRTAGTKDKMYAGLTISAQKTNISNEELTSSSSLNYKKGTAVSFAFEGGYFFSKIAGVSIGAGLASYSANLSFDSCYFKFQSVDTDAEPEAFEMRVRGKSISEDQKISYLSVPVCLNLRYPLNEKIGFYLKAGLSFEIPVVKTYKGTGTFSYDGYYAAYPVLLQNLPAYGFPQNVNTSSSGNLQVKSFSQSLVASGGALYSVNESVQLFLGFNFNKSLVNISGYTPDSNFKLSSKANEMNSIMAGSSDTKTQAFGLSFGLRYYLK